MIDLAKVHSELSESIRQLTEDNRSWMSTCKELCRERLPKRVFESVPGSVWKFVPWGHRCVVLRTPIVNRLGRIIVPDQAKRENTVGWVLSTGRAICQMDSKLPDVAPLHGLAQGSLLAGGTRNEGLAMDSVLQTFGGTGGDCLHIVGECVVFAQWAGKGLKMSAYDSDGSGLDGASPLMVMSIGDIWGPYLDLEDSEWASEQPMSPALEK